MTKLLALISICGLASLSLASTLRSDIDSTNRSLNQAMIKKDLDAFVKVFRANVTSDYHSVYEGKSMNIDQSIEQVKATMAAVKKVIKATVKVVRLKEAGDQATAVMTHHMTAQIEDGQHRLHTVTFDSDSSSKFRLEGGKWKMSEITYSTGKMTFDGKPYTPPSPKKS